MTQLYINNISDQLIPPQDLEGNDQHEVDLNEVLQTVCNRNAEKGKDFILRSDKLPYVSDSMKVFPILFEELISMIVNHPPQNSKLFLYVTCKEQPPDADVIDLRLTKDVKLYKIDFYTNITSDEQWTDLCQAKLAECSLLIEQYGGSFSFFPICNTGCLFSISLPGKIK